MEGKSQQGRGRQTSGIDRAGHRSRFDGRGERVALTLPTRVNLLDMFDDFDLRGNDLQLSTDFLAHRMQGAVTGVTDPVTLWKIVGNALYGQMS